jgi:hypothetical protein
VSESYSYDVFISYAPADYVWVRSQLLPRLAGLRIALVQREDIPGITRVTDLESGMTQSRWVVAVLSAAYLADPVTQHELIFARSVGLDSYTNHLIPIYIARGLNPPDGLEMIVGCDLTNPETTDQQFRLLLRSLRRTPVSFAEPESSFSQRTSSQVDSALSVWAYDVFIIFRYDDRSWIERELLPHLKAASLHVFVAFRDFAPGVAGGKEFERGLRTSRKTLLVLTKEFLRLDWDGFKPLLYRVLDGAGERLVVMLEAGALLPEGLRELPVFHFETPAGRAQTLKRILRGLAAEDASGTYYSADVLVSYGESDGDWVRDQLLPDLEANGLRVICTNRDLAADRPAEIEQALRTSRRTLVMVTQSYLKQGWSTFDHALASVPIFREYRLLPLVEAGYRMPVRISHLTAAYFVKDMERMWSTLLAELRR